MPDLPLETRVLLGMALAALIVYRATPVAIRVAGRYAFHDTPRGYKAHLAPTPYLGGAALLAGFLLSLLVASATADPARTGALAAGVLVLWAIGTVDDRRGLSPALRLLLEVLLATALWWLGFGWGFDLPPWVELVLTCVWVVGLINAFNLFDNMDGATTTMGLVIGVAVAFLGVIDGNVWLAVTAAGLAGSCLGFLPHNMATPARIFLGDGGSMPLGFAVAAVVMFSANAEVPAAQALVVGLLLVGVPVLDTALVMVSRYRRGLPLMVGDRRHLTHRAARRLRTARLVAVVLGAVQAIIAALAIYSARSGSNVVLAAVFGYLVVAGTTIALLEAEESRHERAQVAAGEADRSVPDRDNELVVRGILVVLGLGGALSAFWFGFYESRLWVPIGLGVVTAGAAAMVAVRPRLSRAGVCLVVCSAGLALWTLVSAAWAESVQQAIVSGDRALVAVAVLTVALLLCRSRIRALWLLGAIGAGLTVVAVWVLVNLLLGDRSLFVSGRLNAPFGYINAMAALAAIGLWLSAACAEQRRAAVAAGGMAVAVLFAGLLVLTATRGILIAMPLSVLVVVVLVPGRLRRLAVLGWVAATAAAISAPLLGIYDAASDDALTTGDVRSAGVAVLVASLVAGALWGALVASTGALRERDPRLWKGARTTATGLVALVVLAGAGLAVANGGRISDRIDSTYASFTSLGSIAGSSQTSRGTSRLVSGGGNRYDYWRVAWDTFRGDELRGIGAGNYDVPYYRERRTRENVSQPHSLPLQILAETGIVGALLLLGVVCSALAALVVLARRARRGGTDALLAVAAGGGATVFFLHTSLDWLHLLPGLTAIVMCLLAVLVTPAPAAIAAAPAPRTRLRHAGRITAGLAIAAVFVLAGALLTRQGLAEHHQRAATAALPDEPEAALRAADTSLRLDPEDVDAHYAKAAAAARLGDGVAAKAILREAIEREPNDFVTWALLGDLETRLGEPEAARRSYGRASELNPRDTQLAGLASDMDPTAG